MEAKWAMQQKEALKKISGKSQDDKGQQISEEKFGVFNYPKSHQFFSLISGLVSKSGQVKKISTFCTN
jgi:hypothetical protein